LYVGIQGAEASNGRQKYSSYICIMVQQPFNTIFYPTCSAVFHCRL